MNARTRWTAAWICLLSLSPACLTGCGGPAQGSESPEACCLKIKKSIENKDMGGFYDCLTDESQDVLVGSMIMMKSMMAMASAMGGPEAAQKFAPIDDVMEKHGVTVEAIKAAAPNALTMAEDPASVAEIADIVADKRAFVAEVYAAMDKAGQGGDLAGKLNGELKDLKIEGDKATANLVTADGEEELDFRKTATGWKMHIDLAKLAAKAGPPRTAIDPSADPAPVEN
jgi:hypothetical protein